MTSPFNQDVDLFAWVRSRSLAGCVLVFGSVFRTRNCCGGVSPCVCLYPTPFHHLSTIHFGFSPLSVFSGISHGAASSTCLRIQIPIRRIWRDASPPVADPVMAENCSMVVVFGFYSFRIEVPDPPSPNCLVLRPFPTPSSVGGSTFAQPAPSHLCRHFSMIAATLSFCFFLLDGLFCSFSCDGACTLCRGFFFVLQISLTPALHFCLPRACPPFLPHPARVCHLPVPSRGSLFLPLRNDLDPPAFLFSFFILPLHVASFFFSVSFLSHFASVIFLFIYFILLVLLYQVSCHLLTTLFFCFSFPIVFHCRRLCFSVCSLRFFLFFFFGFMPLLLFACCSLSLFYVIISSSFPTLLLFFSLSSIILFPLIPDEIYIHMVSLLH